MAAAPVAAVAPRLAGAGRGGECDAMEEVRVRMPLRQLGGTIVEAGDDVRSPTVLFPTIHSTVIYLPALQACRRDGRRVVVDSDGNMFAGDGHLIQPDLAALQRRGLANAAGLMPSGRAGEQLVKRAPAHVAKRWRRDYLLMVRTADAVTVTNEYLARVYRGVGAREVFVVPNAVDPDQWPTPPERDTFAVGFAGGPGHNDDLNLIRPALEWTAGQADVETIVFGAFIDAPELGYPLDVPRDWQFPDWRLVKFTPSYEEYRRTLSGLFDVGLMPLTDTAFNRGRSDLKIAEYAMAGALPIVSDAPNYDAWRDTPVLFARDAGEFLAHVQWACAHREEARERARAVRQIVLARHTIGQTIDRWRTALCSDDRNGMSPLARACSSRAGTHD